MYSAWVWYVETPKLWGSGPFKKGGGRNFNPQPQMWHRGKKFRWTKNSFWKKIFCSPNIFVPKFVGHKIFWVFFLDPNFLLSQNSIWSKKFWPKIIFTLNFFWCKNFWTSNFMDFNFLLTQIFFNQQLFWNKKFEPQFYFNAKIFDPDFFIQICCYETSKYE